MQFSLKNDLLTFCQEKISREFVTYFQVCRKTLFKHLTALFITVDFHLEPYKTKMNSFF